MENIQTHEPDIRFHLTELSDTEFEVTTTHFVGPKGIGESPEQALEDLLNKISKQFEEISKEILVTTMHKGEIFKKYKRSYLKNKKISRRKNILVKIWDSILYNFKVIKKEHHIQIFLKDKTTIDSLLQQVGDSLTPKKFGSDKLKTNMLPKLITSKVLPHPGIIFHDEAMLINTSPMQKEIPIQLFLDDEGNTLDDVFPYGIVVNLN